MITAVGEAVEGAVVETVTFVPAPMSVVDTVEDNVADPVDDSVVVGRGVVVVLVPMVTTSDDVEILTGTLTVPEGGKVWVGSVVLVTIVGTDSELELVTVGNSVKMVETGMSVM